MVRVCIAFNVVTRNTLLPGYLKSGTLRAVQYSLKWGTAAFLHSAGTGPPSNAVLGKKEINFARTKAVLTRALKSLTKLLISQFKYTYMSMLKLPINFKGVHFVLW